MPATREARGRPFYQPTLSDLRFTCFASPLFIVLLFSFEQYLLAFCALSILLGAAAIFIGRAVRDARIRIQNFDVESYRQAQAPRWPLDLNISATALQLALLDRDFTPNDYEMLLGLDETIVSKGMPQALIERLPAFKLPEKATNSPVKAADPDNCSTCAICLEPKTPGEKIRCLPCLHAFHQNCIDPWLKNSSECPVCKFDLRKALA